VNFNRPQLVLALLCSSKKTKSNLYFIHTNNITRTSRLISSFSCLICGVLLFVNTTSVIADSTFRLDNASSQNELVGAELFYNQLESGYVKIILNKYYLCNVSELKKSEQVAIHDKAHIRLIKKMDLELESKERIELEETAECLTTEESCYYKVSYSAKTYLTLSEQGFDVTWGSTIIKGTFVNLDRTSKQGISLLAHISNPWTEYQNQAPVLSQLPFPLICGNQKASLIFSTIDKDNDETDIVLQDLYSHEVKEVHEYYYDLNQKRSGLNFNLVGTDESFLTERPPFQKLKYSECQSTPNPLCTSQFSFNKETKELNLKASTGKYLLGLSIMDIRKRKKLSEHSMFLIITVK